MLERRHWRRIGRGRVLIALPLLALLALALLDHAFPPPLDAAPGGRLVLARDGQPLRAFADQRGVWRYPITIDQVAPVYLELLLAYEDRWFHRHPGVNPAALARALVQRLLRGRVISGGSTLSMQVARLLEPMPRTAYGKLKQILRALQLERRLSKRQILALYLNHAPFGGNIEGVQAAAYAYLGKPAAQLSDAEAALLVVLPQRPSHLRPDRHAERAQAARDKVLARMVELGLWSRERAAHARAEQVAARRLKPPLLAPLLAQRLHSEHPGEGVIRSTIDAEWQRIAEDLVARHIERFPEATSAAVLVLDQARLETRVYVGSARFGDRRRHGHVDMVRALRSPGSTLKPFLYGLAIDADLIHGGSLLVDAPSDFDGYRPANFAERFNGPVSAAVALRLSLNVPAVELLAHLGPERFTSALEHAGLRLRLPATGRPNLAVILGGTATSLEELVGAYAALGRAGLAGRVRLRPEEPLAERYLLSPQAAWIIRQILIEHGRPEEGTAGLHPGRRQRIAWKTGTSYGFRDAWAIGSTPDLVIGVWIGRPDGTPLPGSFGAASALPLLFQLADALPRRRPTVDPPPPPGVAELPVCWPLGGLARDTPPELCHRRFDAWVRRDLVPPTLPERRGGDWQPAVVEFWREPSSGARLNASCLTADARPARIARWPRLAYPWLSPRLRRLATLPELARSCRGEDRRGERLVIEGLDPGARLRAPANLARPVELALRVLGTSAEVDWLLDGRRIARQRGGTWFHLRLDQAGRHRLVVIDRDGRWSAVDFEVVESRPALLAGSEP